MGQNAAIPREIDTMKLASSILLPSLALAVCLLVLGCGEQPLHAMPGVALAAMNSQPALEPLQEPGVNAWGAVLILLIFSGMLVLPFWPGLRESLWPRDEYPLPVKLFYSKVPRYLGSSFRRILSDGLGGQTPTPGIRTVRLSKNETVDVQSGHRIEADLTLPHILLVQGDLETQSRVRFRKELYVTGSVSLGRNCRLRALACDAHADLDREIHISRWIDVDGDIRVGAGSRLGVSCSCAGRLTLDHGVEFQRLYSSRITSPGYQVRPLPELPPARTLPAPGRQIKTIEDVTQYHPKSFSIPSGAAIEHDLVVKGHLNLADGVSIHGDIRCDGRAVIGRESVIFGDLFSEGPVEILHNAVVLGNIFSQDSVTLSPGVRIGQFGCIKSIVAKKRIVVDRNVAICGYVLTEGGGRVL
jgi:predicted acyltransferase (DUF342 family)